MKAFTSFNNTFSLCNKVFVEYLLCILCYVLGMWEAKQSPWSQEEHSLVEEWQKQVMMEMQEEEPNPDYWAFELWQVLITVY